MYPFLKEVGRGKRGAKDLSYEQASEAAELIFSGEATPAQIGAFLMAERIKMESADEILAFVHALKKRSERFSLEDCLDCAGPYDGRTKSFFATLPSAFVLSACGLPVVLHGSPTMPPKWGITLYDVVGQLLGTSMDEVPSPNLTSAAEHSGFLFVPTERWSRELGRLRALRQELGVRTLWNTAEKLLRFTDAPNMAIGVFHGTVFEKVADLLVKLGVQRGMVVQGVEGSEDLSVEKRTRTLVIRSGQVDEVIIDPADYFLQSEMPERQWTLALQAGTTKEVLQAKAPGPYENMVVLNSAVRLWMSVKVSSIEEGVALARAAIHEGKAWKKFEQWQAQVKVNH